MQQNAAVQTLNVTAISVSPRQALPDACRSWAVQAKGVGGVPTSFTINLEGSIDGVNWTLLVACGADGVIVWVVDKPVTSFRVNCTAVTLGPAASINVTVVGVP